MQKILRYTGIDDAAGNKIYDTDTVQVAGRTGTVTRFNDVWLVVYEPGSLDVLETITKTIVKVSVDAPKLID